MAAKQCSKCKELKKLCEFGRHTQALSGIRSACRRCRQRHKQRRRNDLREEINHLKQSPCSDCRGTFPPWVMDFDHISDNKIAAVSQLISRGSRQRAFNEIEKCELVCSNCHRNRTYKRLQEKKQSPVE